MLLFLNLQYRYLSIWWKQKTTEMWPFKTFCTCDTFNYHSVWSDRVSHSVSMLLPVLLLPCFQCHYLCIHKRKMIRSSCFNKRLNERDMPNRVLWVLCCFWVLCSILLLQHHWSSYLRFWFWKKKWNETKLCNNSPETNSSSQVSWGLCLISGLDSKWKCPCLQWHLWSSWNHDAKRMIHDSPFWCLKCFANLLLVKTFPHDA